jgi:Na+/H+-dicarboxylate symporter
MFDNLKQRITAAVIGLIGGFLTKVGIEVTPGLADTIEMFALGLALMVAAILAIIVDRLLDKFGWSSDTDVAE